MAATELRRRGRPRDPSIEGRVLAAAKEVVAEVGVTGASMSAIADRAGVGKPTIYLRWRDLRSVIESATQEPLRDVERLHLYEEAHDAMRALVAAPDGAFLAQLLADEIRRQPAADREAV